MIHPAPHLPLKKVLGTSGVTLLGIGALLGGGIFTILGITIGIAGPLGTILAIAALSIGFLCIVAIYAELGTAFPEAGGGYLWIREGLGDLQGFLAGWLSWFAHAAAAGLYSLSFGFYVSQMLQLSGIDWPREMVRIISAVTVLIIFGFINWRGVTTLSRAGNIIALTVLGILILFIFGGFKALIANPQEVADFFQGGLLPAGLISIFGAMSFFFIAFEGSEIQSQAAEEMKNPGKDLPRALFITHVVITVIYLLTAASLIIGFPGGSTLQEGIGQAGEKALPQAAEALLPAGALIITVGGLLVNLGAINATIFSSSHVVLAMARSRHILQQLASVHVRNRTPHQAVLISTLFVIILDIFFPLKEIASIADFLFILLFLQVIIAFLALRYRRPQIQRPFRMPGYPFWPLATVVLFIVLAVALITHISPIAGIIGMVWVLLGLINYFAYATPMEHQEIEESTIFTHAWKTGHLPHSRILVTVAKEAYGEGLYDIALALAKRHGNAEISVMKIDETPGDHLRGIEREHALAEALLTKVVELGQKEKISTNGLLLENADPTRAILGFIALHHINLLVLGWDGHARQGMIFSSKVDVMLREARCDTLVVKLVDLEHLKRILLCLPPEGSPHFRYMGRIASSLAKEFRGTIDVVTVVSPRTPANQLSKIQERIQSLVNRMKLEPNVEPHLITNVSPTEAILALQDTHDAIILGAARERFFREIRVGSVAETVMKKTYKTAMIVRGHQGILPPFWQYLRERV